MKKVILGAVMAVAAVSANAAITSICQGVPSNAVAVTADSVSATTFVRIGFTPKCSNNVHLVGDDNITYYRVGAASIKGKNAFGGSSTGGAVQPAGSCASATVCTSSDASAAANAASST